MSTFTITIEKVILSLLLCVSCVNNNTETKKKLSETTSNSSNAVQNSPTTAIELPFSKDSANKVAAAAILKGISDTLPPNDWSLFKGYFYKHFVGKFGDDSASLNMTFGRGSRYNNEYIYITIHTPTQMYRFYGYNYEQYEQNTKKRKKHLILYPNVYTEDDTYRHNNYGFHYLLIRLENDDFQGFTVAYKNGTVIPLNFKVSDEGGAIPLQYVNHFKQEQVGITKISCSLNDIIPDNQHQTLMDILEKEGINQSWNKYLSDFAKVRNERLKEIKESLMQGDTSGRNGFISQTLEHTVLYNQFNNIVIAIGLYDNDGITYGGGGSEFLQIDVEKNKVIKKADVLVEDWKKKISSVFQANGEDEETADIMAQRKSYGFFTNAGIVFVGEYNHGWQYTQYFVPFSILKPVLKPSFQKQLLARTR